MKVHAIHGVVAGYQRGLQIHRNYVSREAFLNHLRRRDAPYAAWDQADSGKEVLTVDDSTEAGAEACSLAVSAGHEVIFFVNPWQIISQQSYFFSYWDAILDARAVSEVVYSNIRYDLMDSDSLRAFRRAVREQVMGLPATSAVATIREFNALLGSDIYEAPPFARPVSGNRLLELHREGVRIESHGWAHVDLRSMNQESFATDLTLTAQWLLENLKVRPCLYAVPFGIPDLPPALQDLVPSDYMIVNRRWPPGRLGRKCINRIDVTGLINGT
jgi:Polysaccharide deacetylase